MTERRRDSRVRRALATGFVCSQLLLGCSYSLVADGELEPDSLEAIVSRVERVRDIRAQRPINARVVDQAEIRGIVERAVLAHRDLGAIGRYERGLVTVGLWPPDRVLIDEYTTVMGEEIAGLYLPSERTLYVVDEANWVWTRS